MQGLGPIFFYQRIIIYSVAIFLAGAYFSWVVAIVFYVLVLACEAYDAFVFRKITNCRIWTHATVRNAMLLIFIGKILSSIVISFFTISFAL